MTSLRRGVRLGLALLGAGTMLAGVPVSAQTGTGTGAFTERPQAALSRNLRSLAANPKSATALMGAGKAALDLGDAQAALTFFARAEEQMPRDGRIKMWIGSALVQLQQPHAALKFFRDAIELGVPEKDVASDRGLAHDIAGNPRQAQRDYRLALQSGRDPEVTRRLALSLGISGEREAALRLLEDQLLVRDRAAERSRVLVLAMTGDTAGAARAAGAAMPGPQASAMTPFLARLSSLSPAERALAVHLGVFPGDGRTVAPTTYAANNFADIVTAAGRPDPGQASLARRSPPPEPVSTAPRRRPGAEVLAAPVGEQAPVDRPASARRPEETPAADARSGSARRSARSGSGGGNPTWAWSRGLAPTPVRREPQAQPKPAQPRPEPAKEPSKPVEVELARTEPAPTIAESDGQAVASPPGATSMTAETQAAPVPAIELPPAPVEPQPQPGETRVAATEPPAPAPQTETAPTGSRLADLSAALAEIDEPKPAPAAKPKPTSRPAAASTRQATRAAATAAAKKPKAAPEPSRVWVQVAGGADRQALPREYARLKAKAPKLLGSRGAWTVPLNATNRLLVGPFASARDAQAFVNQLKAQKMSGFAWTSAAGQKVEKLPAK